MLWSHSSNIPLSTNNCVVPECCLTAQAASLDHFIRLYQHIRRNRQIEPTLPRRNPVRTASAAMSAAPPKAEVNIALGADAEVVEPRELRERLVATVQELVRLYAPPQPERGPRQRNRR